MEGEKVYNGKGEELVLASFSELYPELNTISVDASGHSSCPISHHLLTTYHKMSYLLIVILELR